MLVHHAFVYLDVATEDTTRLVDNQGVLVVPQLDDTFLLKPHLMHLYDMWMGSVASTTVARIATVSR